MTYFKCITQSLTMTRYCGPSGQWYTSSLGQPFKVENSDDIASFKKNKTRFKQQMSGKTKPVEDIDDKLRAVLKGIKGITTATVEQVVKIYNNESKLTEVCESGEDFDPSILKSQANKIKVWVENKKIKGDK